jgi:hypothetical protein
MRFASLLGLAIAVGVASAAGVAAVTPVTVKITDTRSTLSRQTVPTGVVAFAVQNVGRKPHAFSIAGWSTPSLRPGRSVTLKVTLVVPGPYAYLGSSRGVLHVVASIPAPTTTTAVSDSSTPRAASVGAPCTSPSATTVRVTMTDVAGTGGFTFSPAPIPCGTVTFVLFNGGQGVHGLQLVDPTGTALPAGPPVGSDQSATMTLTLGLDGEYEWRDSQAEGLVTNFGYIYVY